MLISADFFFLMLHYLRNICAIGFSSYAKILIKWKHLKKAGSITVNPSIIKMTKVRLIFFYKEGGKNPPWFLTLKYQNNLNVCSDVGDR